MLLTPDKAFADHVRFLATQAREPGVHYEHKEIGYNYRLSNLLAALGRAQLTRLDDMIAKRREHREMSAKLFADIDDVEIFARGGDSDDNCWLTAILVDEKITDWSTAELSAALDADGIESRPLWKPMHLQPVYSDRPSYVNGSSEALFKSGLALPSGSGLSADQIDRITRTISSFLDGRL